MLDSSSLTSDNHDIKLVLRVLPRFRGMQMSAPELEGSWGTFLGTVSSSEAMLFCPWAVLAAGSWMAVATAIGSFSCFERRFSPTHFF